MYSVNAARPRSRRWLLPAVVAVGLAVGVWLGSTALLARGPGQVVLVYVREENSLGLTSLPTDTDAGRTGLVVVGDAALVPGAFGRIPRGTRVLVVRETFVAGVLAESRVDFLKSFPAVVAARSGTDAGRSRLVAGPGAGTVDGSCALLARDIVCQELGQDGKPGDIALSLPADLLPAVAPGATQAGAPPGASGGLEPAVQTIALVPGGEWRVGAVRESDGRVVILDPAGAAYAGALRQAFSDGRPVSVLSVVDFGLWDTDRIEPGSDGEG